MLLFRSLALLTLSVLFAATTQGQAQLPTDDNQIWNDVIISVPINKQFDFGILGTLRLGRDVSHAVDERVGAGFTYRPHKYVSIQPFYLHIATQPIEGRRGVFENRLSVAGTLRFPAGRFTLSDRSLFERRLRNVSVDATRYRNRLQIEHPVGHKDWKLNVFASDEVFYDWSFDAWVRNRFAVGVIKTFNKHLTADIYYLRQNDGHARPGDLNVLGIVWRVRS
jgi:hypothetical protein